MATKGSHPSTKASETDTIIDLIPKKQNAQTVVDTNEISSGRDFNVNSPPPPPPTPSLSPSLFLLFCCSL